MTIKTHALLAALTTAAVIGFIYYRSSGDENARMRKVIAQAEAAAQAKNEAETAKAAAKEKAAKPAVPEEEKPVESEQPKKPVNAKAEQPPAKPQVKEQTEAKPQPEEETAAATEAESQEQSESAAKPQEAEAKVEEPKPNFDDFPIIKSIVRNSDFQKGLEDWRYWRTTEEKGKQFIIPKDGALVIDGQSNTLMGVAQTVKVVSGAVYQVSARVRSLDFNPGKKEFMGARLAFNAPYQKEQQIVWLYKDPEWREQSLIFTNNFSGLATLFFHTGYTKPQAKCEIKDIRFIPQEKFPKSNECASNGSFKDDMKGWDFWNVKGAEASNAVTRVADQDETYVLIKGQSGGKLLGLCQAVNLTSGAVYRFSATARSKDQTPKAFFGARAAIFAAGQKEKQILWTYNTKGWSEKELIFTNSVSGTATLFFHTGYTTNACQALFKNISLIKKK
ncbi:hypothetical protein IKZ40_00125 [bacterium]|nr:hypothetical protein [bacterium]